MIGVGRRGCPALLCGKADHEACAAPVEGRFERDVAAMALGDGLDDAQTEAAGAGAIAARAEEALEDLVVRLGRDSRPLVLDGEHHVAVAAPAARLGRRARAGW